MKGQLWIQFHGLFVCERNGGWGKAFWWVRMIFWAWTWDVKKNPPKFTLAA